MAKLQTMQFEQEFPLNGNVVCHDLKTCRNIIKDIEGFIHKHNLNIKVVENQTFISITGKGVISSDCTLLINDYGITQMNVYYSEVETFTKDVTWKNLRRAFIMLISCADKE